MKWIQKSCFFQNRMSYQKSGPKKVLKLPKDDPDIVWVDFFSFLKKFARREFWSFENFMLYPFYKGFTQELTKVV